jgi:predicted dehydrogenase
MIGSLAIERMAFAAATDEIKIALVGCGGRGSGAANQALNVPGVKLVAMADAFQDRLTGALNSLKSSQGAKVDVPADRQFVGLDGYKKAIALADVVVLATPPGFRPQHFEEAVRQGKHVFMEKPVAVDGPGVRRVLAAAEEAKKKNLKVGVGLMCRHCRVRGELFERIQGGEIGDLFMLRAYRMQGIIGSVFTPRRDPKAHPNELLWQIKNFHSFLWASGGGFSDFNIHNIDEACWMKNDWPVEVQASGGRTDRGDNVDQNFDHYSCEYTFKDGAKLFLEGRTALNVHTQFATQVHGTKGCAIVSTAGHFPSKAMSFSGQDFTKRENLLWRGKQPEPNPYDLEWEDLVKAISDDKEYNEVERGIKSSVTTAMGRWAAHTGQKITYEEYINSPFEFSPGVENLTMDGPPPIVADKDGNYPFPKAGQFKDREYAMEPQANPFPLIKFGA